MGLEEAEGRIGWTLPLEDGEYVEFLSAGAVAVGEFRCSERGYGVIVRRGLPPCPMCAGGVWERSG